MSALVACTKCRKVLSDTRFFSGFGWCKGCQEAHSKDWPRERYLLRNYGISLAQYEEKLFRQKGLCRICREPPPPNKTLHVDHCHETDRVRALLCSRCNTSLGALEGPYFKDMLKYLRRWDSSAIERGWEYIRETTQKKREHDDFQRKHVVSD